MVSVKTMRHFLILFLLLLPLSTVRAQFFGFGNDPFIQRRERVTQPSYKGGEEALQQFQKKNWDNPAVTDKRIEGRIVVACILNEKGRVVETHVVRSVSREFDEEAERVCRKMRFVPAKRGDKKVKGRYDVTFPIRRSRLSFSTLPTTDV